MRETAEWMLAEALRQRSRVGAMAAATADAKARLAARQHAASTI
jgi:hypothetical protein